MRKNLLVKMLPLFLMLITSMAWAQERAVSGKVTSAEDGTGLPGVNVVVKGTTNGTVTDSEGNYTISTPASGGSLTFSFIGLRSSEVEIGDRTTIDVQLSLDVQQLSEVIITGQGIQREKKALGYMVSSVGSDQLAARPVSDISRVLMGKVPGVVINPTGGTAGAGSQINIRGFSSITGNTQPLWVVDGVPFSSATNDASAFNTGGASATTSRFLDLDPNSIANISVLKGLAATVLYGDQGRNGVILVTTKAGSAKKGALEITVQQTVARNDIASLPTFQNDYGNGFQQLYGNFFSNWGPHFDEIDSIGHPYQFLADPVRRNGTRQFFWDRIPYAAAPSVGGFFRNGLVSNTSVTLSGGTDKSGISASLGYTKEQGYVIGNDLTRVNMNVGFNTAVTSKLSVKSNLMYTNTDYQTPPLNGATGGGAAFGNVPSLYANFLYSPRNLDILDTQLFPYEVVTPEGDRLNTWYRGGMDIPNAQWIARYTKETDITNRFFNSTSLTYDFNDHMSLTYRVGLDYYTQAQGRFYNKGISPSLDVINRGVSQKTTISNTIWNHDFILSYNKQLSTNINLSARGGINARKDIFERDGTYAESQISFGQFNQGNFQVFSGRSAAFGGRILDRTEEQQRYGVYGDFSLDYKSYVFLNLAGRNDWTSNLEKGNNSLFYPSASLSFVPTEAFPNLKSKLLNSFKFRLSYGTSAGFPPLSGYATRTFLGQNPRGFVDVAGNVYGEQTIANQLGNAKLRAELQQELEAGFEVGLFNNRLNIDFAVYDRSTRDLITNADVDPSTGYTAYWQNIGRLSNKGIEIGLNATPLRFSNGFQWDVTTNFTLVRPVIEELAPGISQFLVAGFSNNGNYAVPGRPFNIIKGDAILRAKGGQYAGQKVVGFDGLHVLDPQIQELANPNPNFLLTLINNFSFKGISFSFQWDYRAGGQMIASTPGGLLGRGVLAGRDQFDRDQVMILPGVKEVSKDVNGNSVYAPNDIFVTAADYGFNSQFFGRNDNNVFDVTTIRLREVSIGYTLPKSILAKTPIKAAAITINGNNLFFNAVNVPKYVNFDPEVASLGVNSGAGFDYLTGPSMRRYGVVLRLTF
jgi:TonB-linked SusC/RagA family outer membrane protein